MIDCSKSTAYGFALQRVNGHFPSLKESTHLMERVDGILFALSSDLSQNSSMMIDVEQPLKELSYLHTDDKQEGAVKSSSRDAVQYRETFTNQLH